MTRPAPIPQLVQVIARPEFVLGVRFTNGEKSYLQLTKHLSLTGYFAPLAQRAFFQQVWANWFGHSRK